MTSCTLGVSGDPKNTFYMVGTAFVDVGAKEPTQGRVLVFHVSDSESNYCMLIIVHTGLLYSTCQDIPKE